MKYYRAIVFSAIVIFVFNFVQASNAEDLSRIIPEGNEVVKLNTDINFEFTEGPCWDGESTLYFTDVRAEPYKIWKMDLNGNFELLLENNNRSNGIMFLPHGNLAVCEMETGKVVELNKEGNAVKALAAKYRGKRFNSPNDLVVTKEGGIYCSDPGFGRGSNLPQDKLAVYYVSPKGEIARVVNDVGIPNGVILSPDEKTLYVLDTQSPIVHAYDIQSDGTVTNSREWGTLHLPDTPDPQQPNWSGADGLAVDIEGNLYITSQLGVQVFNEKGEYLGTISVPEKPSNCVFGGTDYKTLFITAQTSVYKIDLKIPGIKIPSQR